MYLCYIKNLPTQSIKCFVVVNIFVILSFLRYLAASNFMLSGTALLRGIPSIDILKQKNNLIVPVSLIFVPESVAKMNGNFKPIFMRF